MTWEAISTAMTNFSDVVTSAIGTISSSPALMAIFVGGSLLPVGFKLFKRAKKAVR